MVLARLNLDTRACAEALSGVEEEARPVNLQLNLQVNWPCLFLNRSATLSTSDSERQASNKKDGQQKMVTTLSELVEKTQGRAVPSWLRDDIFAKKDEIARALRESGEYTLVGPNGEQVVIQAEKQTVAA